MLSRDYRAIPGLDNYDPRDIDDAESGGSFGAAQDARLAAERAMEQRDDQEGRVTGRRARLPGALEGAQPALLMLGSGPLRGLLNRPDPCLYMRQPGGAATRCAGKHALLVVCTRGSRLWLCCWARCCQHLHSMLQGSCLGPDALCMECRGH